MLYLWGIVEAPLGVAGAVAGAIAGALLSLVHGTTDVKHLGHVASHGCVRLDPKNAKALYDLVDQVGMGNVKIQLVG